MVGALGHGRAVNLISIADQVTWSFTRGKCLCDLARDPVCSRTRCYVDQPDYDEDVEQLESHAWNPRTNHGGDLRRVVAKEGPPPLRRGGGSLNHVLRHARLSDFETELQRFAVDTPCLRALASMRDRQRDTVACETVIPEFQQLAVNVVHPKENSPGPSRESAGESRRRFWDTRPAGDHMIDFSKSRLYCHDANAGPCRLE
jgi:hypothetical protein